MEDPLEVSHRPYDGHQPMVCFDEGTKPRVQDIRAPLPAVPGHLERLDSEYERHGTGHLLLMCEPLADRREVLGTEQRTAVDSAQAIQHLVDVRSPAVAHIVLVQDTLHTPTRASLYEAFPPEEARRLSGTREGHDTPKHGS